MVQIISPQLSKLVAPAKQLFQRFKDRGFKLKEQVGGDNIKTKKDKQEEVNKLYTGSEMASDAIYA